MGKTVEMKFEVNGEEQWFDGIIMNYNGMTGKHGIYFPCDGEVVEVSLQDDDVRFK